jgi:hypothetical protein
MEAKCAYPTADVPIAIENGPIKFVENAMHTDWHRTNETEHERTMDAEMAHIATLRVFAFKNTKGELWLAVMNDYPQNYPTEYNEVVFRLLPSSSGWKVKSTGVYYSSDFLPGPSLDRWWKLRGGRIRVQSKSCDAGEPLIVEFSLERNAKDSRREYPTVSGMFSYTMANDYEGFPECFQRAESASSGPK